MSLLRLGKLHKVTVDYGAQFEIDDNDGNGNSSSQQQNHWPIVVCDVYKLYYNYTIAMYTIHKYNNMFVHIVLVSHCTSTLVIQANVQMFFYKRTVVFGRPIECNEHGINSFSLCEKRETHRLGYILY